MRPWLALFVGALVVRAGIALLAAPALLARAPESLMAIAIELARGHGFSVPGPTGAVATAALPPLTPWLASGFVKLAGPVPLSVMLGFAVISSMVPCAIAALGAGLMGGSTGLWAGLLCALDPILLASSPITTTAATLLSITTLATVAWLRTPRPGRAFGVGLLWGTAALAHTMLLAIPVLVVAWAWVPLGLTLAARDRIRQLALMIVGVSLVVVPWTARNIVRVGAWPPSYPATNFVDVAGPRAIDFWSAAASFPAPMRFTLAAFAWLVLPLFIWGTVRALSGPRRWFQAFVVVIPLYGILGALVFGADLDARGLVEPMIALLAAAGIDDLRLRRRARLRGLRIV